MSTAPGLLQSVVLRKACSVLKELQTTAAYAPVPSDQNLLNCLPLAIYTTDAHGRITFFNDAAASFAGRQPAVGEMWCVTWRLFWPNGAPLPHDQCPMAIALRERRPVRGVEALAERPDGSRVPFMPYPTPLFDESGELIGAINALVDLTDQKHAQAQFAQAQALAAQPQHPQAVEQQSALADGLARSRRDFELLVRSVTDYAIFMLDPTGHVSRSEEHTSGPHRPRQQLEQRRGAHQGLSRRRNHRPAFLALLHPGRPGERHAAARAHYRPARRPL